MTTEDAPLSQPEVAQAPERTSYTRRREDVLHRLFGQRHELAARLVEEFRNVIPEYQKLSDAAIRDVVEMSVHNITHVTTTFADVTTDFEGDIEWLRRSAVRRLHQHVSLASLLRTYRLSGTMLWRAICEECGDDAVGREVALDCADAMMRYTDSVSSAITQAYLRESMSVASGGQALRTDVLETLVTGEPVSETARRHATTLAMTLRERSVFVVLVHVQHLDAPSSGVHAALRTMRELLATRLDSTLVGARDAEIVAIMCPEAEVDQGVLDNALQELVTEHPDWSIGVGRTSKGVAGVRSSYEEARMAVDLGIEAGWAGRVVRFADVMLDQILRSAQHLDALLEETVQPLVDYDAHKRADLVPTLRAYIRSNLNMTKAAAVLGVNPNTVVYRLRRIRELTGRDPNHSDDLLLLAIGLRLLDSVPPDARLERPRP